MERKKSKEADLERSKASFFLIGLVMISATVLMAFTYVVADPAEKIAQTVQKNMQDELVFELDVPEDEPEPEPEQAPPPPQIDEIEIVEDEEEVEEIDFSFEEPEDLPVDEGPVVIEAEPIADFAEVEPTFPGGEGAMMTWIQSNIEYPQLAVEMGEQGIVYVQFVVNKDGSIEQVKIMRGVSDALDDEAKRVVKKMPKWTPGEQAGKKVRVRYTLPIHFRLG
jgi:protein TonB